MSFCPVRRKNWIQNQKIRVSHDAPDFLILSGKASRGCHILTPSFWGSRSYHIRPCHGKFQADKQPMNGGKDSCRPRRQDRKHRRNVYFRSLQGTAPDPNAAYRRKLSPEHFPGTAQADKFALVRPCEAPCEPYRQTRPTTLNKGTSAPAGAYTGILIILTGEI